MSDPSGFITAKIASMLGGLFGGAAILTFIKPKTIGEAFTRGGISVGSAIIFGVPLLDLLRAEHSWEFQLMAGFCVGFLSYSILGMIANFLQKNQNSDIAQAIQNFRNPNNNLDDSKDKK